MSFSGAIPSQRRIVPVTAIPDFGEDGFFIRDDFAANAGGSTFGELGWVVSGGSFTSFSSALGHPGIVRKDTSAVSGTISFARLASTAGGNILPAELFDILWIFRLNHNDADTAMRVGWAADAALNPPADGIYLEKVLADISWFAVTRAASVQSRSAALAAVDTGWHKIRIRRIDAATIGFTLDAATEVTLTTNVPVLALNPFLQIINGAAASKTFDADYFSMRITGLNR